VAAQPVNRLRSACQATGPSGAVSRGGRTRGDSEACEPALGRQEQATPWGMVEADGGPLRLTFGSAAKTRAGSGETLAAWGTAVEEAPQVALTRRQSPRDTGPARSGRRPQGWQRMVACCEAMGQPMQRRYAPHPPRARLLPVSGAGASWHGPGLGPRWSRWRRGWSGPQRCRGKVSTPASS
jgi:hypothetical protein